MNCGVCSEKKDRIWAYQWKAQPYTLVRQEGVPELGLKDIGSGTSQCADWADGPQSLFPPPSVDYAEVPGAFTYNKVQVLYHQ